MDRQTANILQQSQQLWALPESTEMTLLAERENKVFRVDVPGQPLSVLRIHRTGYHSDAALNSELLWMNYLAEKGMSVPVPLPAADDSLWLTIDNHQVDRLSWLEGEPFGVSGQPLALDDRVSTFHNLGACMARLHEVSDNWNLPAGFTRHHWDTNGLVGEQPFWGRFWENPRLTAPQRTNLEAVRDQLRALLAEQAEMLDYGLIHADMVRENVFLRDNQPYLLDFDDAGFGFRLFELATTLFKNRSEPDYPELEAALIAGYTSVRPLDVSLLPAFMLLRALTYVGWIVPRLAESEGEKRCAVNIQRAVELAEDFLWQRGDFQ